MPRYRTAYPPEFRRQMVDLVRSGRTPEELAREFEPTAQSISTWVKQAERERRRARTGLPVHERAPGHVSDSYNGPRPERFGLGLLCLAEPTRFGSGDRRRRSDASYPHDPRWIACNLWRAACSR